MQGLQEWRAAGRKNAAVAAEDELLRAGSAGDRFALERLLESHASGLHSLCRSLLGHADDAEDAVQETFLRALRGLSSYRHEASFYTWLCRIAVHVCLDWKRARRTFPFGNALEMEQAGALPGPEAAVVGQIRVQEALRSLLPRQRVVLILREREGWSVSEIGQVMRWNEKRVQNELYKARCALAEWRLREREEEEKQG